MFVNKVVLFFSEIDNIQFYCSKAEDVLPKLIGRYRNEKVVAIVDPPRAGLRKTLFEVKALLLVKCQLVFLWWISEVIFDCHIPGVYQPCIIE